MTGQMAAEPITRRRFQRRIGSYGGYAPGPHPFIDQMEPSPSILKQLP